MKLHYVITFIFISFISSFTFGQAREGGGRPSAIKTTPERNFSWDKVMVGGNVGAQFGDITIVEISPTIGYKVTENLLSGFGARYIYVNERFFTPYNIYGGAAFSQYAIFEQFVLHAEMEYLSIPSFSGSGERNNFLSPLVGGGFRYSIGGNNIANFLILFNLNDDIDSPYSNPIIRINLGFGL